MVARLKALFLLQAVRPQLQRSQLECRLLMKRLFPYRTTWMLLAMHPRAQVPKVLTVPWPRENYRLWQMAEVYLMLSPVPRPRALVLR